jgi:hypothetical protein
MITQGEKDYYDILTRASAESDLEELLAHGTPQAQSYALVGIHKLDPVRFKVLVAPLRSSKTEVFTGQGCILMKQTLAVIVQRIEAGGFK